MSTKNHADLAGAATPEHNRLVTLKAEAAQRGITIHKAADGGFLATQWNLCRYLSDVEDLRSWLKLQGIE